VTDSRMKGRVKGLFGGPTPDQDMMEPTAASPSPTDPDARQALQVLVLAQRTADDHVAQAQQHAEQIRADARAAAERVARDAHASADATRREAGKVLADARGNAEQMAREAQAHSEAVRREADQALAGARERAAQLVRDAEDTAEGLERDAQQRYEEAVGGLAAKRAALKEQIGSLQQFDRDYRARLRTFMQGQLQALGVDEPPPIEEVDDADPVRELSARE